MATLLTATRSWVRCRACATVSLPRTPCNLSHCHVESWFDSCHARGRDQDSQTESVTVMSRICSKAAATPWASNQDTSLRRSTQLLAMASHSPRCCWRMVKESGRGSGRPDQLHQAPQTLINVGEWIVRANAPTAFRKQLPLPRPCWSNTGRVLLPAPPVPSLWSVSWSRPQPSQSRWRCFALG